MLQLRPAEVEQMLQPAPRIDRMLKLADFLETVPVDRFDMEHWGTDRRDRISHRVRELLGFPTFTGCAMGWATHERLFEGLAFACGGISYAGRYGYSAAAELLGISIAQAHRLFCGQAYHDSPTPRDVATRLRSMAQAVEYETQAA